jgi:hypothetical protein
MTGTMLSRGNLIKQFVLQPTLTPTTCTASVSTEQSFTIIGLMLGDVVEVMSNVAPTAGVTIGNSRVSATNTLLVQFSVNGTTGLLPASGVYNVIVSRPEGTPPTVDV